EPEYDYPLDAGEGSEEITTSEDVEGQGGGADEGRAPADGAEAEADADSSPSPEESPAATEESPEATEGEGEGGGNGANSQATNHYDGDGGVQLSSFFDRILYALKYSEPDILLNTAITSESQILYERDPSERVEKVAPFLTVDGKPYPAVVDGRVQWVVDAYTTSSHYPYSTPIDFARATEDTFTQGTDSATALPGNQVNYIRNSVKATVDAYDGTVAVYGWDDKDPVLKTWSEAFPGV